MTYRSHVPFIGRCIGVAVVALLVAPAFAIPDESNDRSRELEQVRERIKSVQDSIGSLETRKGSLVGQLAEIEQRYGLLSKSLRQLEGRAKGQHRQMGELRQRKRGLRDALLRQSRTLAGHTRAAYAAGRREWLRLLLNQEDAARVSRMITYYGYLNRARLLQLQRIKKDLSRIGAVEDELLAETERLRITRAEIQKEQAELDAAKRQRKVLLGKLEHEYKDKNSQLRLLQEDEQRLQGLIAALQHAVEDIPVSVPNGNRSFADLQGQLGWPVSGELREQFGAPRMSGRWDGILIKAQEGTPVRAVSEGRVAFSDWLRGYGLLTIIDHGDGYMSLYAFNQSLYKGVGEWVNTGEIIASVGASGGQAEPGLYFGIRDKGRPMNPLLWCKEAK